MYLPDSIFFFIKNDVLNLLWFQDKYKNAKKCLKARNVERAYKFSKKI